MGRRPGLSEATILDAATELVDEQGVQALSLAALAARFGVKSPSLYNHVRGLEGVRRALALRGMRELGGELQRAIMGRAGSDAFIAMAHAYRAFATRHPGLYAMIQSTGEWQGDAVIEGAAGDTVDVVLAMLQGYRLEGDEALHATRAVRSALHGFVSLETSGGFGMPLDRDESFARLLALLDRGLRARATPESGA